MSQKSGIHPAYRETEKKKVVKKHKSKKMVKNLPKTSTETMSGAKW